MSKSAEVERENIHSTSVRIKAHNKMTKDIKLMAKLTDMKSKIDLLQMELNYEMQQLELLKKQNAADYATASHLPQYPHNSNSTFTPQNTYANYTNGSYLVPIVNSNYCENPYMFGYNNVQEAQAAFCNSLDHAEHMCNNEIRNTTQDICNLKKIRRDWMHCQPYNSLGSPAGDDMKELDSVKLSVNQAPTKHIAMKTCQFDQEERTALKELSNSALSVQHNVKRVRRMNQPTQ